MDTSQKLAYAKIYNILNDLPSNEPQPVTNLKGGSKKQSFKISSKDPY